MDGKYENKLVKIEYSINDKGSAKVEFKRVENSKYIGAVGMYKGLKVYFSSEGSYNYELKELKLPFGLCTGFVIDGIKEKNLNYFLEVFNAINGIPFCDNKGNIFKGTAEIENSKYIKHPNRAAFLNVEYCEYLANQIKEEYEESERIRKYNNDFEQAKEINYFLDLIKDCEYLKELYNNKVIYFSYLNLYHRNGDIISNRLSSSDKTLQDIIKKCKYIEEIESIKEYLKKYFYKVQFDEYNTNICHKIIYIKADKKNLEIINQDQKPKYKDFKIIVESRTKRPYFDTFTYSNYILEPDPIKEIKEIKEPEPVNNKPEVIKELPEEQENNYLPVLYKVIKESENNIKELDQELKEVVSVKKTVQLVFSKLNKGFVLISGNTYPVKEIIKKFNARFYKNFNFNGNIKTGWVIKENCLDLLKTELNK